MIPRDDRKDWWENRRWKYNKGLFIALGISFFVILLLSNFSEFDIEITLFTIPFQILSVILCIGFANLLYYLGYWAGRIFNEEDTIQFRERLFNLGYWFSIVLPFINLMREIVIYFVGNRESQ